MTSQAEEEVASIRASWAAVVSDADAERCVERMAQLPSTAWRTYLDELHQARAGHNPFGESGSMKMRALSRHEEELYASVAAAIADEDDLVCS